MWSNLALLSFLAWNWVGNYAKCLILRTAGGTIHVFVYQVDLLAIFFDTFIFLAKRLPCLLSSDVTPYLFLFCCRLILHFGFLIGIEMNL